MHNILTLDLMMLADEHEQYSSAAIYALQVEERSISQSIREWMYHDEIAYGEIDPPLECHQRENMTTELHAWQIFEGRSLNTASNPALACPHDVIQRRRERGVPDVCLCCGDVVAAHQLIADTDE